MADETGTQDPSKQNATAGADEASTARHAAPDTADAGSTDAGSAAPAGTGSGGDQGDATGAAAPQDAATTVTGGAASAAAATEPARRSPPQSDDATRESQRSTQDTLVRGPGQGGSPDRGEVPQGRPTRSSVDIGEAMWKVANVVATIVRVIGYALTAVLLIFIVLTVVGVNPLNAIARIIGSIADVVVLSFRDLFLPADPLLGIVLNYGLAAVFWLLLGEFLARVIRFAAARLG